MRMSIRSLRLVTILVLAVLALSGCFQDTGGGIQPTDPGQAPAMIPPTATIIAAMPTTAVAPPTAVVAVQASATPFPQASPMVATAAGFSSPIPSATQFAGALGQQASPTSVVPGALATNTLTAGNLGAALTATAIIMQASGGDAVATATPFGQPLVQVSTPTVQSLSGELTATALVAGATQAAYAQETMTATAMGILPPTMTFTPTATFDPNAPTDCVHTVQRGENAYRIARQYGVTLDDLARANGSPNLSTLSIGQELLIPECGILTPTPGPAPLLAETEATEEAAAVEVTEEAAEEEAPATTERTHLIQPGENLYRIAIRYGVTVRALQNANGISNVNYIRAGDTLIIP
jgi:LysM repeat protein